MNQPVVPAGAGDILYTARVMLFIMLLCMGYELSRPVSTINNEQEAMTDTTVKSSSLDRGWGGLPPWQKKASEKAVERYTKSQEKKWRRWNEAMFERSD